MNPCDVAIFMGRCEKALFQATFGHKTRTLILIASVSKLAFLYGGERGIRTLARIAPPIGFRDRPLQPGLGISPTKVLYQKEVK